MNALTFTLELNEPLLIANPISGDENSATGLNYIPGSVIRGALAQVFTKGKPGALSDNRFKQLFFGDVRFLNAFMLIDGARSLPTPLSWQRAKDASDRDPVLDLANSAVPTGPVKRLGQPFVRIRPAPVRLDDDDTPSVENVGDAPTTIVSEPARHISVHILQQDRHKAVQSDTGTVFRYDALAAGECFAGAILSDDEVKLLELKRLLEGASLKLGKSRSAGYGAVSMTGVAMAPDWQEFTPKQANDTGRVVVSLLSDAIVRDARTGAYVTSLARTGRDSRGGIRSDAHHRWLQPSVGAADAAGPRHPVWQRVRAGEN